MPRPCTARNPQPGRTSTAGFGFAIPRRFVYRGGMSVWALIYRLSFALVIGVALFWLGIWFYPQFKQVNDMSDKQRQIEEEIRLEEEALRHLRMKQERLLNDRRFVEKIAREELGLAKPGETVFKFVDDPTPLNVRTGISARTPR